MAQANTNQATAEFFNLPNQLTIARVFMAAFFVAFLSFESFYCYIAGYVVFTAAAVTDYYDGKIARERNLVSNFGKLLDPVADKILLSAAFVMMVTMPALHVPAWTVIAILAREFLITGARSLAASQGVVIAANKWGKTKTVLQMVFIFVFLAAALVKAGIDVMLPDWSELARSVIHGSSLWASILVALFTVYSGFQYVRMNWNVLMAGGAAS